jgi:pyruvate,water dikinase
MPAVVGTGRATAQIKSGQMIRVDGTNGVVTILGEDAA